MSPRKPLKRFERIHSSNCHFPKTRTAKSVVALKHKGIQNKQWQRITKCAGLGGTMVSRITPSIIQRECVNVSIWGVVFNPCDSSSSFFILLTYFSTPRTLHTDYKFAFSRDKNKRLGHSCCRTWSSTLQWRSLFWIPPFPHFLLALYNWNGAMGRRTNLLRWHRSSEGDKCHTKIKWFCEDGLEIKGCP